MVHSNYVKQICNHSCQVMTLVIQNHNKIYTEIKA